ncbi:uncharacterized protein [Halyomorpha halys]|uniref:uncharacterized protein n=1 Tax=Halyomorpha halys TaxID=286706 RepID=UPI0006D4DB53|nr:uncharacterized protein LOC106679241 [Halyomorpha halys]
MTIRQWLSAVGLQLAAHKTEAVLIISRKMRDIIGLSVGEFDILSKPSIRYLGVQIETRLRLDEHIHILITYIKAAQVTNKLPRIMSNIGGPRENQRKPFANVASFTLLYAALIWLEACQVQSYVHIAIGVYRRSDLHVARVFCTVSYDAVCVIADTSPIDRLTDEHSRMFRRKRERYSLSYINKIRENLES